MDFIVHGMCFISFGTGFIFHEVSFL
jgi:hypothetical protein